MLTWVEGEGATARSDTPALIRRGRALSSVGSIARSSDLDHEFKSRRLGVHDTSLATSKKLRRSALDDPPVTNPSTTRWRRSDRPSCRPRTALPALPSTPRLRVVHGDPKLANMVFTPEGTGHCLIDLDTLARMALPLEMGDAIRSWCNPGGEKTSQAGRFDHCSCSRPRWHGYAVSDHAIGWLTPEERDVLFLGARTIALELAARGSPPTCCSTSTSVGTKRSSPAAPPTTWFGRAVSCVWRGRWPSRPARPSGRSAPPGADAIGPFPGPHSSSAGDLVSTLLISGESRHHPRLRSLGPTSWIASCIFRTCA